MKTMPRCITTGIAGDLVGGGSRRGRGRPCRPRAASCRSPDGRGRALVVVVDELDLAPEKPALGIDVLGPDLERRERGLAVAASPPVSAMPKPTLIGSAACAEAASDRTAASPRIVGVAARLRVRSIGNSPGGRGSGYLRPRRSS